MPPPAPVVPPESTSPCVRPPRLAPAAPGGTPAPAPAIPEPKPAPESGEPKPEPVTLKVYEVRDLVVASGGNERLLADLKPALPTDAQSFTQGEATIVVKTTAAGQEAADRWLTERRQTVTPVMKAHPIADLTPWMPLDTLMDTLRAALPAGTIVNQQGTGTLVIKGTPAAQESAQRWLEERRQAVVPAPSRTRYFDVKDLLAGASGDELLDELKVSLPVGTEIQLKSGTVIVKAPVETLDVAERWLAARRQAASPPK